MSDERVSWDDLRYLEALGRLGTAGRAARELNASASTVYRRINHLEKALGITCVRSGEGRLTAAGEALADVVRETKGSLARVLDELRREGDAIAGEVSLTTVEGVMPLLAGPLVALRRSHPELVLRLIIGDDGPSVRRREVDLAFSVMPRPPESLWGRRLFPIHYGVYAHPSVAAAEPRPWVVTGRALKMPERASWEAEHARHIAAETNSVPTLLRLVHEGMGAAVLPRRLGDLDDHVEELFDYRASLESLSRSAWLLTHPDRRNEPRIRTALALLGDALRQDPSLRAELPG